MLHQRVHGVAQAGCSLSLCPVMPVHVVVPWAIDCIRGLQLYWGQHRTHNHLRIQL